ncbi:hypothetical protein F5144DRAFT_566017 [Chaetomium tenue]|uniref:Uncharacterized protein n=1 Tax=Chaetomium tenue TaxID=1854479 RepID=A0ACB7PB66_9PEZI|nr:hypothetical protein F5144DRAFT_566017 [Chaetomium globosum]
MIQSYYYHQSSLVLYFKSPVSKYTSNPLPHPKTSFTMTNPTVFVCGATGAQGGRLAHRLRAIGWGVHTTVRDPTSTTAQSLQSIGVETTPGDWNNEAALAHSLAGCQMLFLNLYPTLHDIPLELHQAQTLLRLARAAHIQHVVYTSSIPLPTTDPTSLPALARASKRHIEAATRTSGIPAWTILRPAFFMTNFVRPNVDRLFPGASTTGEFTLALRPDTPLSLIDPDDIAQFAVAAFRAPGRFHGQVVDLAGEVKPMGEVLGVLARVVGKGVRGRYLGEEEVEGRKGVEVFLSGQLDLREAVSVDVGRVRTWGVEMGTLEGFLERERRAVEETYGGLEC